MKTINALILGVCISLPGYAKVYEIKVSGVGFEPSSIKAAKGEDVVLKLTRTTDGTCAQSIEIPSLKISKKLPLNKPVEVKLGKLKSGEVRFGCSMDMMMSGIITVN